MSLAAQQRSVSARSFARRSSRVAHPRIVATAAYKSPSSVTSANTLQALSRMSNVVPDTPMLESSVQPKAATVSSLLLSWVLANEQLGMKLYQVRRQAQGKIGLC
eukprot:GHRQ01020304.1.p1 GENE.GHRQ01020304.1~~GHRQ01020304.1.p1  ORF type:complete len:105 (-),score=5.77 GHRQ01020304.1:799-1113(-)